MVILSLSWSTSDLMEGHTPLAEEVVLELAIELLKALGKIHDLDYMHRDFNLTTSL